LNLIPLGSCVDVRALLGPGLGLGLGLNSEYYYLVVWSRWHVRREQPQHLIVVPATGSGATRDSQAEAWATELEVSEGTGMPVILAADSDGAYSDGVLSDSQPNDAADARRHSGNRIPSPDSPVFLARVSPRGRGNVGFPGEFPIPEDLPDSRFGGNREWGNPPFPRRADSAGSARESARGSAGWRRAGH
jgi:hypothetical protein